LQQISTSDKFCEFYELWRKRDYSVSANIGSFHRLNEIDEKVGVLADQLDEFEVKLEICGKMVRELTKNLREYVKKLRICLERVTEAQSIEDLNQVEVQNMEWYVGNSNSTMFQALIMS